MIRKLVWACAALLSIAVSAARGQSDIDPITRKPWFEARSAHFNIYSCGDTQEVFKVAARLEQFNEAYSLLAGAQAVNSPPIIVIAFPDIDSMKPFLPIYNGQPANLAGFFKRGTDENLIALALDSANTEERPMAVIFHEYTHLLMRRNAQVWPLWLDEGMAEVYSTFEANGYTVTIGQPIDHHLQLLAQQPLLPLADLFNVTHDSPQYNERERQGIFYAESWLLTHFLMVGDNPVYKARFGQFTRLLRQGQQPTQAFTNALGTTLPAVEGELRRYLDRGVFNPIQWTLRADLSAPKTMALRVIGPAEICFHLGDELLRINRQDAAEAYFLEGRKRVPGSPLPYGGLGLLAVEHQQPQEALRQFQASLQRGSTSFLVHYYYANEKLLLTSDGQDRYTRLSNDEAEAIRSELQKSIALMPNFGPAQEKLGFLEMLQGDNLTDAEKHLRQAILLEPENNWYLLSLAQVQWRKQDPETALRTLESLRLPYVDETLRERAGEIIQEINKQTNHGS